MRKNGGLTLIELLVGLAITSIISPMIVLALTYCFNSYNGNINLLDQQTRIINANQYIRLDIERASDIQVTPQQLTIQFKNGVTRHWKLEDNALKLESEPIVKDLDLSQTKFTQVRDRIVFVIQPQKNISSNAIRNQSFPMTVEYSVRYK